MDMSIGEAVTFIAGIATIVGVVIAALGYMRSRKQSDARVGGDSSFKARDITGSHVVINTGSVDYSKKIDYVKEDQRNEWKIYEVAFLWNEMEPPGTPAHFQEMSREIEAIKEQLHAAVDRGELKVSREIRGAGGLTRWVKRDALVAFALARGERPKFLFPEAR